MTALPQTTADHVVEVNKMVSAKTTERRQRMAETIERRAQERGYHLSAEEQLANLAAALAADNSPCPHCGATDDEPCRRVQSGKHCTLEEDNV